MAEPTHPLLLAIDPLIHRIGAAVVDPSDLHADDVELRWDGEIVAGIRLAASASAVGRPPNAPVRAVPDPEGEPTGGLDGIITDLEAQFGSPLAALDRPGKQRAVRMLEESGAFSYRKSVETVAAALGISRFTVYNYLNRDRD
jgi:hypothetical protein